MTLSAPPSHPDKPHRGTIFVEDATVLDIRHYAADQFVLRVEARKCARHARPGSFAHVRCDETLPMRRPLSIMRANADEGWIEMLFKIVGGGLRSLSHKRQGDTVSVMGPIGQPFRPTQERPYVLLVGGGVGIPPMIFLAEWLKDDASDWHATAFMGSEIPFPFEVIESRLAADWAPAGVNSTHPLLERWQIPCRLATKAGFDGCFDGFAPSLVELWLEQQSPEVLAKTEIFTCGPTPMLRAMAATARKYGVACQVSLEEFMACAVGGCAGCAVEVMTDKGRAMKRVCVDGPVFDAATVFRDAPLS